MLMVKHLFDIEGLSDLQNALDELPKATSTNVLKRALLKAAEPIASAAESLAPVRTGRLRRSFVAGTSLSRRQKSQHHKESKVEIFAGAGALVQAITSEFGTAKQSARPFMRPAWDSSKKPALDSIRDDIANEIEKARKRLARKAERLAAKMKSAG